MAATPIKPSIKQLAATRPLLVATLAGLLAACGGGEGSSNVATAAPEAQAQAVAPPAGTTRADAFRLLTQASFGPTDADLARAMSLGAAGWVDEQLAKPAQAVHLARYNADDAAWKQIVPGDPIGARSVISSFYERALRADDQLRQRMAFALSEIFVVSLQDLHNNKTPAVASWYDMLTADAFGNFRTLLQDVAMHPAMGMYLSSVQNLPANPQTGRIPDQNFAREVMQLFTIGLRQLNADGSPQLDAKGNPIDTYGSADIAGLSSVFTGFSWAGPDTSTKRFYAHGADTARLRYTNAMQAYPQFHAADEKRFLGITVPAGQGGAADARTALDTLFKHPNVAPFISRQLIQRLVTSNPSPAYVARVAAVFNNNGAGVRGDLKAVARAILLDADARATTTPSSYGKLREPVLRLTAYLRAFNVKSDSGQVLMNFTDDAGLSLGQTPLASPSVFNFFRPGYVPPGGEAAQLGLALPEMQITSESSVAGYVNFMLDVLARGAGTKGLSGSATRPDLQTDLSALRALADQPSALVAQVTARLLGEAVPAALSTEVAAAVASVPLPALAADGRNRAKVEAARLSRVQVALALVLASPEYIVQK
jgi:uncharacterized protein (DUF1800 family)